MASYRAGSPEDVATMLGQNPKIESLVVPNSLKGWNDVNELARKASTGTPHAGGTMNTQTWHLAKPGDEAVFVGGQPDSSGKRIETAYEGGGTATPSISPLSILQHANRIRKATGNSPRANLGLWVNPDIAENKRGIDVDASTGVATKDEAIDLMKTRPSEEGAWSMKQMAEDAAARGVDPEEGDGYVPSPHYDPNTVKPSH
jgi:hypothetical protein